MVIICLVLVHLNPLLQFKGTNYNLNSGHCINNFSCFNKKIMRTISRVGGKEDFKVLKDLKKGLKVDNKHIFHLVSFT